jgi:hypothetical protein
MSEVDPDKPEGTGLFLPSDFVVAQRATLKLGALAKVEYSLREGLAYDALMELRTAIRTFNYNKGLKKSFTHGVGRTTRAGDFMKTLSNDVQLAADAYRRQRVGLVKLGLSKDDLTLRPLEPKAKLDGKGGKKIQLGDSQKVDPWFWNVFRPSGMSSDEETEWEMESTCHSPSAQCAQLT